MTEYCEHEWAPTLYPNGQTGGYGEPLGKWTTECVKCGKAHHDE